MATFGTGRRGGRTKRTVKREGSEEDFSAPYDSVREKKGGGYRSENDTEGRRLTLDF